MNQALEKPSLESLLSSQEFKKMLNILSHKARKSIYRFSSISDHPIATTEDLISEGVLAAIKTYPNFDPSRGDWCGYTYMYVLHAMQVFCKKNSHQLSISEREARDHLGELACIGVVRIDRPIQSDGNDLHFDIPVGSGVDASQVDLDSFYFNGFSDLEVSMFKEHIIEDRTLQEIALKYGISRSTVFVTIDKMSKRIRERVEIDEQKNRD